MGILNITPDSFSDGCELGETGDNSFQVNIDKVLARAESMIQAGAVILDVGGESTRPGAEDVAIDQELERVIPVLDSLHSHFDICLSVDTSSPEVMREAIAVGANLVNDVRALTRDNGIEIIATSKAAVCLMHMQGQPRTMQKEYHYENVVQEVRQFLAARVEACEAAGIGRDRLLVDPGFGFGKSVAHNFELLKGLQAFAELDVPLLVGLSRKSMLGAVTDREVDQRLAASVAAATLALQGGARIIRSHDVAATVDAIRVHCAYTQA